MKSNRKAMIIVVMAATVVVGISGLALAHGGWGGGRGGHMMGPGYGMMGPGYGMMGPGYGMMGPGYGMMGPGYGYGDRELSREQAEQLEALREDFFRDSRKVRQQLFDIRASIGDELRKDQPNRDKIVDLQKQARKLQGQLDELRLDYQLKARKIVPEGFVGPRGFGGGFGPMGPGWCWR